VTDANLIADLIRAGTDPDLVQRVALELGRLSSEAAATEKRRAADRERKRSPRNSADSAEGAEFQEKEKSPRTPLKENHTHARDTHAHARELAPDWKPSAEDIEYGRTLDLTTEQIDADACRFRDRALAAGERYRDPHAAFRSFLSSPHSPHRRANASKPLTVVNGAKSHATPKRTLGDEIDRIIQTNPLLAGLR
jgi:hypothetical protein